MAKQEKTNREKALEMYLAHDGEITPTEVARQLGEKPGTVRSWKNRDDWDKSLQEQRCNGGSERCNATEGEQRKRGAPKGNLNAKNNIGGSAPLGNQNAKGHGAPKHNSNAVITGEYQTIWDELLTEKEKKLMLHTPTEVMTQLVLGIKKFELQEFRMTENITKLRDEITSVQIITKVQSEGDLGKSRTLSITEESVVDKIQRIEEALTRVREKKGKYLELKFKLEQTNIENGWKEAELSRAEQNLLIKLEELAIKQEKLALDKARIIGNEDEETEDDGLMEQLNNASGVWDDYEHSD